MNQSEVLRQFLNMMEQLPEKDRFGVLDLLQTWSAEPSEREEVVKAIEEILRQEPIKVIPLVRLDET